MKTWKLKHFALIGLLYFVLVFGVLAVAAFGDVSIPSGTKKERSDVDFQRNDVFKVGNLYLGDTSANTLKVNAPELADDLTVFTLPATNRIAHPCLATAGPSVTSWIDVIRPTATQSMSNKPITDTLIDLGAASDTNKIVHAQAAKASLDALTREAGSVYFATDLNR